MPKKVKDFELSISVRLSKKSFLIFSVIMILWNALSFFYMTYVAQTGTNPIVDWSISLPQMLSGFFSGYAGAWGAIVLSQVIIAVILVIAGLLWVKYKK